MSVLTETEFECVGKVRLGDLAPASAARLALLGGEWLEFSPEEGAVVVRHVQPGGSPALSAVPSELIAMLDALPAREREVVTGGTLLVRDRGGVLLRIVVEAGEIRVQWPREDWSQAVPVGLEEALRDADPFSARVSGRVRFAAPAGAEVRLAEFVDRFEGLYPAGELDVLRSGGVVDAELRDVNVGPAELLAELRRLAAPADSVVADLEVGSFRGHASDRDFRLSVHGGKAQAVRPSLWGGR